MKDSTKITKLKPGYFDDVKQWYEDNNIPDVKLRLWTKEALAPDSEYPECDVVYITQIIKMENGDYMIGYQHEDDRYDGNKYPYIEWDKLSEIALAYAESDQD